MRISTSQMQQLGVDAMLKQQSTLSRTQQQLATGRRILSPSDDPVAAARVLDLNQTLEQAQQYNRNAQVVEQRLRLEEAVLENATDVIQRAYELSIQANNATVDAEARAGIAVEIGQLLEGMLGLANTKDANNEYLFGGLKRSTQPVTDNGAGVFTYNGDQGQRQLQVGPSRQVADGDSGFYVFMDVPDTNGGVQDIFTTLQSFKSDLEANTPNGETIDNLRLALDRILSVRADVGARMNAVDVEVNVNEAQALQVETTLSDVQDLDYAEAVARLNLQLAGLQAAQQSYVRIQGLSLFNYL